MVSASVASMTELRWTLQNKAIFFRMSAGSGFSLDGQVLGFGFENGKAELIGETFSADSDIDGDSEFRFERIPSGNYSLVIRGTAEEIAIEALTIS